jgi:hypothetical protein
LFAILSLTLVAAGEADASRIKRTTFTCPIGGEKFEGTVVLSGYQRGQRLDFRPYGAIVSPAPLPQCPGNGFVMYKDEFSSEEIAKLKSIVAGKDYQALQKQHRTYFLAAYLEEKMGEATDRSLASRYLRASWQAEGSWSPGRTEKPSPQERDLVVRYRTLALEKLNAALAKDERGSKDWLTGTLLAAELERLLGRFDAAQKRLADLPAADASDGQRTAREKIRKLALAGNSAPAAQGSDSD